MMSRHLSALLALSLLALAAPATAQTDRTIAYQGQLDHNGVPVDQPVPMTFHFYGVATGGSPLQSVAIPEVDVRAGRFAVDIGPVSDVVFDAATLYLAVDVDGAPLEGRTRIRGVPYAIRGEVIGDFRASDLVVDGEAHFGAGPRQMLNLHDTRYGIGVQASTLYQRSDGAFQWYTGGTHADDADDAGGGTRRMSLRASGELDVANQVRSAAGIAPGASERLGLVRGTINGNGSIVTGASFTVTRVTTGVYDVSFSQPFAGKPTVVCSGNHPSTGPNTSGVVLCLVDHPGSVTANKFRAIVANGDGDNRDYPFSFIAMGPR